MLFVGMSTIGCIWMVCTNSANSVLFRERERQWHQPQRRYRRTLTRTWGYLENPANSCASHLWEITLCKSETSQQLKSWSHLGHALVHAEPFFGQACSNEQKQALKSIGWSIEIVWNHHFSWIHWQPATGLGRRSHWDGHWRSVLGGADNRTAHGWFR
jgi:hypothetical protein